MSHHLRVLLSAFFVFLPLTAYAQQGSIAIQIGEEEGATILGPAQLDCPSTLLLGQTLTFNGSFSNTGTIDITNAFFRMTVNDKLSLTPGSASQGTWSGTAQQQQLNMGTVAPGQTVTFDLSIEAVMTGTASIETAFGFDGGSLPPESCEFEVVEQADVFVQKIAVVDGAVGVGENFIYALFIGNNGLHTATNVQVVDLLPEGLDVVNLTVIPGASSVNPVCEEDAGTVFCNIEQLGITSSEQDLVEVAIVVRATQTGTLENSATVTAGQQDPNTENNTSDTVVLTIEEATLSITKTASLGPQVPQGSAFTYTVTVTNTSEVNATEVKMTDQLPANVTVTGVAASQGTCDTPQNGMLMCDLGDLPGGGSATITISVNATTVGDATNIAFVGEQSAAVELEIVEQPISLSICGQKWYDDDEDGVQDPEESGLNGFEIELLDESGNLIATTTTGNDDLNGDGEIDPITEQGRFCFDNLDRGTYILREKVPDGWMQTFPAPPGTHTVTIATGSQPRVRFGNVRRFKIRGEKYLDLNHNGVRDPDEPGLDGFEIELLDAGGTVIARTHTRPEFPADDPDGVPTHGIFCFNDLAPGVYILREVVPSGWIQTAPAPPGTFTVEIRTGTIPELQFGNVPDIPPPPLRYADFGDAPDPRVDIDPATCGPISCYPTLSASSGPFHVEGPVWLGATIDTEVDGQPTFAADGDDFAGDDEDGLISYEVLDDGSIRFVLAVTINPPLEHAYVDAWVDDEDDGFFSIFDQVLTSAPVFNGTNTLTSPPGFSFTQFPGFMRFRISSAGGLAPTGGAADGEVEDYVFFGADFGDAPASFDETRPEFPGGYPTTLAQDGARHPVFPAVRLGDFIDARADVNGSVDALEDDQSLQQDDEDGFRFLQGFALLSNDDVDEYLEIERSATLRLLPLPSVEGFLDAWVDWNRDGDWEDDGEQIFADEDIDVAMLEEDALTIEVPPTAQLGYTYARFRFSRIGGLSFTGAGPDGEVEDYLFQIVAEGTGTATEDAATTPHELALHANYPNPFTTETTLRYTLPETQPVRLAIFDVLGREVAVLAEGVQPAGSHQVVFNAADLPSGVYISRLETQTGIYQRQLVVVR